MTKYKVFKMNDRFYPGQFDEGDKLIGLLNKNGYSSFEKANKKLNSRR